ncbi:FixG Ig-like domain-containing protein, partial [Arthrospira platensis SPKY1]|nr:FixG Ig-like domain-containing protein [Arthrospira platensis SPKY1]
QPQTFSLSVSGLPDIAIVSDQTVSVLPTEVRAVAVTVQVPPNAAASGSHPIVFEIVSAADGAISVSEKSVFIIPR